MGECYLGGVGGKDKSVGSRGGGYDAKKFLDKITDYISFPTANAWVTIRTTNYTGSLKDAVCSVILSSTWPSFIVTEFNKEVSCAVGTDTMTAIMLDTGSSIQIKMKFSQVYESSITATMATIIQLN